jgi:hypothetical protein
LQLRDEGCSVGHRRLRRRAAVLPPNPLPGFRATIPGGTVSNMTHGVKPNLGTGVGCPRCEGPAATLRADERVKRLYPGGR